MHTPTATMTIAQITAIVNKQFIMPLNTAIDLRHPSISHTMPPQKAASVMIRVIKPTINEWPSID